MGTAIPQRLGDFEILRELGRGGMGVVYEARQLSLNRKVALKVLSGGLGLTPKAVQRFHREAEAAARLHHTNIVPVYATGEEHGTHFYAMELIDGPSLDLLIRKMRAGASTDGWTAAASTSESDLSPELVQTGPYVEGARTSGAAVALSSSSLGSGSSYFDAVARMVAEVADALEYAHQNGVIHRDIKPANLLLSSAGRLSVNDFGLARMLEQPGMTMSGEFVGTPAYMSPEQITTGRTPVDHRTDIYSLGATLYELLTLHPPFAGERRDQVLAQILHKEPRRPRKMNKKVPVDLETVCMKAMEKDPDRRYQTAGMMAEDLRRYVNRFAIMARRASLVQRFVKWVRRRPAAATMLGCLLVAVGVALAFAYRAHLAEQERQTEQEKARQQVLDEKIRNVYLIATSGDLTQTDEAIKGLEQLGASDGQVCLLRGMVHYFRGDSRRAMDELEQAVQLLPESCTARAILCLCHNDYGSWSRSTHLLNELRRLVPESPEDYLFKGYACETCEPGTGMEDLDEGIRQRNSALTRALRGIARTSRAQDTGKQADIDGALEDIAVARAMLPKNAFVLSANIFARIVAAGLYTESNHADQSAALWREAGQDVETLQSWKDLPFGCGPPMWLYYHLTGQREKALKITGSGSQGPENPGAAYGRIVEFYLRGQFEEACRCNPGQNEGLYVDTMRLFALAELPNGFDRALREYGQLSQKYPPEGLTLKSCADMLLFLGKHDQAVTTIQQARDLDGYPPRARDGFVEFRQYLCGTLSDADYLATAGQSRKKQVVVHMNIALSRLALGDRAAARDHFQKAVATRFYDGNWIVSEMFLSRLNADHNWPPWISPQKQERKP
jgi:serine/threonine protein kinase